MRGVRDDGDAIVIGAMTTHDEVMHDPLVAAARAAAGGRRPAPSPTRPVRHRGTFGGSLAHADPAGDLPAVALALGARAGRRRARRCARTVAAADFFSDYLQTALGPDEVLVEVRVPKLGTAGASTTRSSTGSAQAWALVGVAALVQRSNGSIAEARVGLTNMGSTPVRAAATESGAGRCGRDRRRPSRPPRSTPPTGTTPPTDLRRRPDYRRHLARVLTRRAVAAAAGV